MIPFLPLADCRPVPTVMHGQGTPPGTISSATAIDVPLLHPGALDRPRAGRYGPFRPPDPGQFDLIPPCRTPGRIQSSSPGRADRRSGRRGSNDIEVRRGPAFALWQDRERERQPAPRAWKTQGAVVIDMSSDDPLHPPVKETPATIRLAEAGGRRLDQGTGRIKPDTTTPLSAGGGPVDPSGPASPRPRPATPLSSRSCILVRPVGHELNAAARFALPILALSSGCRPSAPDSAFSRRRPIFLIAAPNGAPAAPRPGAQRQAPPARASPRTGQRRDRGRPRISSQQDGAKDRAMAGGARRRRSIPSGSSFADLDNSRSLTMPRTTPALRSPRRPDPGLDHARWLAARSLQQLPPILSRSRSSGSPASGARSCICGQPSLLERSSRNSTAPGISLRSFPFCRRSSGPWIHGPGARPAAALSI